MNPTTPNTGVFEVSLGGYGSFAPPQASVDGAVPTRLDTCWPSPGTGRPAWREQDTMKLPQLRSRSRNLEQANPLAHGTLDRAEENIIGRAVRIVPRTVDKRFNRAARKWLERWAVPLNCDVRGLFSFTAIMRLTVRAWYRDGDIGIVLATIPRLRPDGRPDLNSRGEQKRDPRLQLIEGDRVKDPPQVIDGRLPNGNRCVDGVEMDRSSRPVAYHVQWVDDYGQERFERVDARDFVFLHRANRYSFVRGEGAFRGTFTLFDMVWGYLEAVVSTARAGASQAMIAKRKNPLAAQQQFQQQTTNAGQQQRWMPIEPLMINFMGTDEDLVAFDPKQPQQNMPEALDAFSRLLGIKFGLTLEQVLLNFKNLSWSTSKAVRAQAEETAGKVRHDIVVNGVSRIYQWALSVAVQNEDVVDEETGEPVPAPRVFWPHLYIPPAKPSTDPLKDAQANEKRLQIGVTSHTAVCEAEGEWYEDVLELRRADRELREEYGEPEPVYGSGEMLIEDTADGQTAEADDTTQQGTQAHD